MDAIYAAPKLKRIIERTIELRKELKTYITEL
jgi:hypothetical protein